MRTALPIAKPYGTAGVAASASWSAASVSGLDRHAASGMTAKQAFNAAPRSLGLEGGFTG